MGKLLIELGISEKEQSKLPKSIFEAEVIIEGLMDIYNKNSDKPKAATLQSAIAESVVLLLAEVEKYKIEAPEQKETQQEQREQEQREQEEREQEFEHQREEQEEEPREEQPEPESAPIPKPKKQRKKKEEVDDYKDMDEEELAQTLSDFEDLLVVLDESDKEYKDIQKEIQKIKKYIN